MKFDLSLEDFTIIQNALHYYKQVPKRGHFGRSYYTQNDATNCETISQIKFVIKEKKMSNTVKYLIVGLVATVVWEFGHPYIPGLVVDHPHTHEEAVR